jgi:hypothetical protein
VKRSPSAVDFEVVWKLRTGEANEGRRGSTWASRLEMKWPSRFDINIAVYQVMLAYT